MKDKKFQQKLVDKLRSGKLSYGDAPIYTIILDLVQGNGKEEVLRVFNEVIMEEPKTTGDIGVDYALAQSKAIQKSMHLDAEMAYRSLDKKFQQTLEQLHFEKNIKERMYSEEEVLCKHCKKTISVNDINNHLFMTIKGGGLIHWNCETI